jgi:two-component system, NtrC family, response regulator AtoC
MGLRRHSEEETAQQAPHSGGRPRVVVFWEGGTQTLTLPARGAISFGRALDCDVPIDHPSVSRKHAALRVEEELTVEDLGSSNGTRVGARQLAPGERARVVPGEVVELGSAMFIVQAPGTSARAAQSGRSDGPAAPAGVVVCDPAMQQLHRLLAMVAPTLMSVLIRGETGVGKEVVAETLHRLSPRAARPFLCLNCAALPEALLESELFGHERGAFTGAVAAKPGLLEMAAGGTVFLDEVGELPPAAQAKLLRAVESRQVTRVGGLGPIAIDVRFVAATHRDIDALVATGEFRQDLYFRLNGISIRVPPLRERKLDIAPLAEHFVARAAAEARSAPIPIAREALDVLEGHPWPGNIRELKNAMDQATMFSRGQAAILAEHLPGELKQAQAAGASQAPPSKGGLRGDLDAFERQRIVDALEECSGNQTRAARLLGISRRTLVSRLSAHGLPRPRKS